MYGYALGFYLGEKMIRMEEVIGSRVSAERFTPVMIDSK